MLWKNDDELFPIAKTELLAALVGAAVFLSSEASQFINGHILYVDGGILSNFGYVEGEND